LIFHEESQYTDAWKSCSVYKSMRCLSKNRLKFSTIKTPRALNREDTDNYVL